MAVTPRKRPRQQRAQAMVEAIVEAAARIFESEGPSGYTTNAIAERAGASIGSLYQYFPDKDAITAALIRRETARFLADARESARAPDWATALQILIDAAVGHQLRRPDLARLIDVEEARLPLQHENRGVTEVLEQLIDAALFRPAAPRIPDRQEAAGDLIALVKGMVDAAGERGEEDAERLGTRVRAAAFGYLATMERNDDVDRRVSLERKPARP
ncbi:TetR/AcrR family transcriptional regulator [Sphingomonas sp. TDK1]|uniref:TetR/AcrR family transcriptional regulator n=1 Tax=Sphingomonas sp. TDK1 TaxID=453247 RepID=UPI0007D9730A|nr:TetR/AcrR family transcriptional regulator [Sphingomonas sp. TDK1]OAN59882.1 hypothetical protein A7X12_01910 [Sphingomonas sp. TDK1]